MISHSKKLIFIHIPKTGGKNLARFLLPYCDADSIEYFSPFTDNPQGNLHACLFDYWYAYGEQTLKDYSVFAICRNPWDRALSLHLHQNNNTFNRERFREVIFEPLANDLWVHSHYYFLVKAPITVDPQNGHWTGPAIYDAPKSAMDRTFYERLLHYPHFLRFERYAEDVSEFFEFHGIKHDLPALRKKTNTTTHKHYSHYYQHDEIEHIREVCGLDLHMLGYKFDKKEAL